ncbi:MAG: hypothetical protein NTW02_14710 [Cyanobium sp. LacPavin_0920_WC12_MAG_62_9]|jgi:hypothetical protein|nr:hypothetical protein [Cyanobium sp. LacPavin_0920_WC12_MAG_62_9]
MTYLSMLDDSQSEMIGGGIFDVTTILALSFAPITRNYNVGQANNAVTNVISGQAFLGSPLVAAQVTSVLSNTALLA